MNESGNLSFSVEEKNPTWPEYKDKKSRETWIMEVAIILSFVGLELPDLA